MGAVSAETIDDVADQQTISFKQVSRNKIEPLRKNGMDPSVVAVYKSCSDLLDPPVRLYLTVHGESCHGSKDRGN